MQIELHYEVENPDDVSTEVQERCCLGDALSLAKEELKWEFTKSVTIHVTPDVALTFKDYDSLLTFEEMHLKGDSIS